jgi:hypothetical protein
MEDTMQVLYFQKKCAYLNTTEIFYVHKEASLDNQLNDTSHFSKYNFWHYP